VKCYIGFYTPTRTEMDSPPKQIQGYVGAIRSGVTECNIAKVPRKVRCDLKNLLFEREIAKAKSDPKSAYTRRVRHPTAYLAVRIRRTCSSRSGSVNEPRLLRNGQILHRILKHVFITIAIPSIVFFLLTCTGVFVIGRLASNQATIYDDYHSPPFVGRALLNKATH